MFEAFAGVGTQHMALKRAGVPFEIVGISEIDEAALKSYMAIHGDTFNFGDISKIEAGSLPSIDFFTYSFPCQDISISGHIKGFSEGSGTRSSLLWECKKIIETAKPKYLLLENVKNLVSERFQNDFQSWLQYLESLGYTNRYRIINALDYLPQNRERVFVVSVLDQPNYEFTLTNEGINQKQLLDYLEPLDVSEALSAFQDSSVKSFKVRDVTLYNTKSDYFKPVEAKSEYVGYIGNAPKQATKVYLPTKAKTLVANGGGQGGKTGLYYFGDYVRNLSPLETWRLTGISDDDFYKAKSTGISNSQLYKQAGNAIVVDVLVDIFSNLFKQ